ncbi:MAG: hypothetical protein AB1589_03385 [Cyanobacteriota bacterium]
MSKNMVAMPRKWLLVPIGAVSIALVSGYALFGISAKRPLSFLQSPNFGAGLLPVAPSSILNKEKWSAAFGLARHTLTTPPVSSHSDVVAGQRYDVPLPIKSYLNRDRKPSHIHSYITLATSEQLDAYYSNVLPEAGWKLSDRMGGTRIYAQNTARLFVSDSFYLGTRITQLNFAIDNVNPSR